jgi:hypothetical protein
MLQSISKTTLANATKYQQNNSYLKTQNMSLYGQIIAMEKVACKGVRNA